MGYIDVHSDLAKTKTVKTTGSSGIGEASASGVGPSTSAEGASTGGGEAATSGGYTVRSAIPLLWTLAWPICVLPQT